jgi:hypothetical protein
MSVPTKTVYVKDETLWERAKALGGKDGLSAVIAEALASFVERKELEKDGFTPTTIYVDAPPITQTIRFFGRLLGETLMRATPDSTDFFVQVFQTQGKKLVLIISTPGSDDIADEARIYESLADLAQDEDLIQVPPGQREPFLESLEKKLGMKSSVIWIA